MRKHLRACAAAFTFLTRLPFGRFVAHDAGDLSLSLVYFPIVGLFVGAAGSATFAAARLLWTPLVAVLLSVGCTVLITGAFHEDALADAFDGFGGGWNREQVLAIMKDSRVGSYALVGVLLVLGTKIAALTSIVEQQHLFALTMALIAGHVLGRWSSVVLLAWLPYVRPATDENRPPTGLAFASERSTNRVAASTVIMLLIVVLALRWKALMVLPLAWATLALGGVYVRRRIGGITGDAVGAINQMVELMTYLALAARP